MSKNTTTTLTNAEFAGYAARLAQKAASWAADTAQGFRICAPDDAMDREPAMRFIAEMRQLLDHVEAQVSAMTDSETTEQRVCEEILSIMATYHEQEASYRGVDTPGGLEHMGDVWKLFWRWERMLKEQPS